ncbi:MAG: MlaD family protein [Pseudomonadota bacterium]
MSDHDIAEPERQTRGSGGISIVWIVPILAALIGGAVAWQSISSQGPLVEIYFSKAAGVKADKTEIKHKDVVVGIVEDVRLSEDLNGVIVSARLDKEIEPYLGNTTDFWIVSANVTGGDISGLSTILSGSYIEVDWSSKPTTPKREFDGLDNPPLTPPGVEGQRVSLETPTAGSISVGSPVFYRGIKVGRVETKQLAEDFRSVKYQAFVEAPYDQLLSDATSFWNQSGVAVEAGTDGLTFNFGSLESVLSGGVAFDRIALDLGDQPLSDDKVFKIHRNREAAVESQFEADTSSDVLFMIRFDDSIQGLEQGAPVEWQGIRIGTVNAIRLELPDLEDEATAGQIEVYVVVAIQPSRVGLDDATQEQARIGFDAWVKSGMRAQLATGNILAGRKLVRFVDEASDDGAQIDFSTQPFPTLPSMPSGLDALTQNVEEIVQNLSELPLDQLVGAGVTLLNNTNALVSDPDMQELPAELNDALVSLGVVASNLDQASADLPELVRNLTLIAEAGELTLAGLSPDSDLYVDLSGAVKDLRDASRSLSGLAARLEEKPNALITGR